MTRTSVPDSVHTPQFWHGSDAHSLGSSQAVPCHNMVTAGAAFLASSHALPGTSSFCFSNAHSTRRFNAFMPTVAFLQQHQSEQYEPLRATEKARFSSTYLGGGGGDAAVRWYVHTKEAATNAMHAFIVLSIAIDALIRTALFQRGKKGRTWWNWECLGRDLSDSACSLLSVLIRS